MVRLAWAFSSSHSNPGTIIHSTAIAPHYNKPDCTRTPIATINRLNLIAHCRVTRSPATEQSLSSEIPLLCHGALAIWLGLPCHHQARQDFLEYCTSSSLPHQAETAD
ncbi:MAG: hypothetical protein KME16_14090 [Scytolyngbya sp. HA4215-MV1]|nr:hypothetical protein [Scytolyngbya sp. HA4215-MV1]